MKKMLVIPMTFVITSFFIACGGSAPAANNTSRATNTVAVPANTVVVPANVPLTANAPMNANNQLKPANANVKAAMPPKRMDPKVDALAADEAPAPDAKKKK